MPFTLVELKQIIDSGDFSKFIGEVEGQLFDAKQQPYRFEDGSDVKREFAKDVAAFANTRSGSILIGLHTKVNPVHAGEEVDEIRPIPGNLFDPDQCVAKFSASHKFLVPSETFNPDRMAFQLIRELYIWFGHSEEAIPYKKETETGFISDTEAIAKVG